MRIAQLFAIMFLLGACRPKPDTGALLTPDVTHPVLNTHVTAFQETGGVFTVDARAEANNVTFANRTGKMATFTFTATGQWSFAPTVRFLGPTGSDEPLAQEYILPRAPRFSLILQRADGSYDYVGDHTEVVLSDGECISFLMNDIVNGASDNRGQLQVQWARK